MQKVKKIKVGWRKHSRRREVQKPDEEVARSSLEKILVNLGKMSEKPENSHRCAKKGEIRRNA